MSGNEGEESPGPVSNLRWDNETMGPRNPVLKNPLRSKVTVPSPSWTLMWVLYGRLQSRNGEPGDLVLETDDPLTPLSPFDPKNRTDWGGVSDSFNMVNISRVYYLEYGPLVLLSGFGTQSTGAGKTGKWGGGGG